LHAYRARSDDTDIRAVPGDIADRRDGRALDRRRRGAVRAYRDTLINNAGVFIAKPFTQ
jgi:hypothetical protein